MPVLSKWFCLVMREEVEEIYVKSCHGETYFARAKELALS